MTPLKRPLLDKLIPFFRQLKTDRRCSRGSRTQRHRLADERRGVARLQCKRRRKQNRQHRNVAGRRRIGVGDNNIIVPRVIARKIGDGKRRRVCAGNSRVIEQIGSLKTPLITNRRLAGGFDGERSRTAHRPRQTRRLSSDTRLVLHGKRHGGADG